MAPIFSRNVGLGPALKASTWRKIAIGTWRTAGDPSVYGMIDIEVEPALRYIEKLKQETGARITMSHLAGKILAETLRRHPDINCILRLGRLYPRKSVDVFFQVASDPEGKDLSGTIIREADSKSVVQIANELQERIDAIRKKGDPDFQKMKGTMSLIPGFLVYTALNLVSFLTYTLNVWTPLLGSPRDPFGSIMITNIGSLGLDTAFAPLVPYSRVPVLVALGAVRQAPVVRDGQLAVGQLMRVCATFDHRLIDGVHGARMSRTLLEIFANPERELG